MKTTSYVLIILGLILPITLSAQDAPSRPLKDPGLEIEPTPLPKSSASPTAAPTPQITPHKLDLSTPTPAPSATPEASQPPTPTATPEETPAKNEESSAEATPSSTPVKKRPHVARRKSEPEPAEPTPQATPLSRHEMRVIAAKLKVMEKEWEASFNNPTVIEKTLTDDFVGTSPVGNVTTKKELLGAAKEDKTPSPKTITHDLDVHFCAPDIAIVTGAAKQIARSRSGQVVEYHFRFTDTWVERDGQWRCFASQSMLIPPR